MSFYRWKHRVYAVAMQLDFMSFSFAIIFPRFGFEVFYMKHNPVACEYVSGYRVYREGMQQLKADLQLAVYEQFMVSHE